MTYEEQAIQTKIVTAFRRRFDAFTYACPNGGARTKLEALGLKDAGLTAGVPDLQSTGRDGAILYIEVKRPSEIKASERKTPPDERILSASDSQKVVIPELRERGFTVVIVCSVAEAIAAGEAFGFGPKRKPIRSPLEAHTGF